MSASDGIQRVATPATQAAIDGRFDPVGAGPQLLKGGIDLLTGVPLPAATLIAPSGASVLSVAATEVLSLSSETDILVVTGDADDELLFSDGG